MLFDLYLIQSCLNRADIMVECAKWHNLFVYLLPVAIVLLNFIKRESQGLMKYSWNLFQASFWCFFNNGIPTLKYSKFWNEVLLFLSSFLSGSRNGRFSYGYSSFKGKRSSMEDFFETKISEADGQTVAFFGVFDGKSKVFVFSLLKSILYLFSLPSIFFFYFTDLVCDIANLQCKYMMSACQA